jgi:hypothetical protein
MTHSCTVLVRFTLIDLEPQELFEKMNAVRPALKKQDGYIGSRTLVRDGGREVVDMIDWRDRSCHDRCQTNPAMFLSGAPLLELVQRGAMNMSVEYYHPAEG